MVLSHHFDMTKFYAMTATLTDHTASTVRAGAGAGTEAMEAAPSAEVPTSPTKSISRRLPIWDPSPLICQRTQTVSKPTFNVLLPKLQYRRMEMDAGGAQLNQQSPGRDGDAGHCCCLMVKDDVDFWPVAAVAVMCGRS